MGFSKKKIKFNKENEEFTLFSLFKSCLLFFAVFLALCILFSVAFSLIFYQTLNPDKMLDLASVLSLYISAFISAFLLSKKNGQKYILGGTILGLMILLVLVVGSFFTDTKIISAEFLLKAVIPFVCILGSVLGIKREKKIKRKHR
ncbi:MAG: TIGR04086 family membrane protein [Clostridia bacterium]|nr:TIGR04086 family membrane protein [Clostridia bacterium]